MKLVLKVCAVILSLSALMVFAEYGNSAHDDNEEHLYKNELSELVTGNPHDLLMRKPDFGQPKLGKITPSQVKAQGFTPIIVCDGNGDCAGEKAETVRAHDLNPVIFCRSVNDCQGIPSMKAREMNLVPVVSCTSHHNCRGREPHAWVEQHILPVKVYEHSAERDELHQLVHRHVQPVRVCESLTSC